jgi:hypothetical protein
VALVACVTAPTAHELRTRQLGIDRRCPEGGIVAARTPPDWRAWGLMAPEWTGYKQIVYETSSGQRTTWCEYTQRIWDRQKAAIWANQEPTHDLWDVERQERVERERQELAALRGKNELQRLASWQSVPGASSSGVRSADEVYGPIGGDGAEQSFSDSSPAAPLPPDEEDRIAQALTALATARGAARVDAVCAARMVLREAASSSSAAELVRAERSATRQLEGSMKPTSYEVLVCSDGWTGSSCDCHRGNRAGNFRGCCSWHGGVRGCETVVERPTLECE